MCTIGWPSCAPGTQPAWRAEATPPRTEFCAQNTEGIGVTGKMKHQHVVNHKQKDKIAKTMWRMKQNSGLFSKWVYNLNYLGRNGLAIVSETPMNAMAWTGENVPSPGPVRWPCRLQHGLPSHASKVAAPRHQQHREEGSSQFRQLEEAERTHAPLTTSHMPHPAATGD